VYVYNHYGAENVAAGLVAAGLKAVFENVAAGLEEFSVEFSSKNS